MAARKPANGEVVIVQKWVRLLSPVRHHGDDYPVDAELELPTSEADSLVAYGAAEVMDLALPKVPAQ